MLRDGCVTNFFIGACGDGATTINDAGSDATKSREETNTNASAPADESVEKEETDSNVEENDDMRAENTYTNKELGITGEVGPMKYYIFAVQLKKITIKSESAASLFDAEIGDEVHGITMALDVKIHLMKI